MLAYVASAHGPLSAHTVAEMPLPLPGPGQVRLRVSACALNPIDVRMLTGLRRGTFPLKYPYVPGYDVCGTVDAVGAGARHIAATGQRVFVLCRMRAEAAMPTAGGLAEYVIVPAADVVPVPPALSSVEAAALPLGLVTAVRALRREGRLRAGQRVLIIGGAGGVGHLAIQVARSLGATVSATCRPAHRDALQALGANEVIDHTATDLRTLGQRFDLVLDTPGVLGYGRATRLLVPDGAYISTLPGAEIAVRAVLGPLLSSRRCPRLVVTRADEHLRFATSMLDTGRVRPHVAATFPFTQVHEAFEALQRPGRLGKVVVTLS